MDAAGKGKGNGKVPFGVPSGETIADAQPLARSQQFEWNEEV